MTESACSLNFGVCMKSLMQRKPKSQTSRHRKRQPMSHTNEKWTHSHAWPSAKASWWFVTSPSFSCGPQIHSVFLCVNSTKVGLLPSEMSPTHKGGFVFSLCVSYIWWIELLRTNSRANSIVVMFRWILVRINTWSPWLHSAGFWNSPVQHWANSHSSNFKSQL